MNNVYPVGASLTSGTTAVTISTIDRYSRITTLLNNTIINKLIVSNRLLVHVQNIIAPMMFGLM